MKQFDHMIERKLNLELSNVFPRLSNVFPRLKFLAGCGQFSDFSNNEINFACTLYTAIRLFIFSIFIEIILQIVPEIFIYKTGVTLPAPLRKFPIGIPIGNQNSYRNSYRN
jgi:hypothetical protein